MGDGVPEADLNICSVLFSSSMYDSSEYDVECESVLR